MGKYEIVKVVAVGEPIGFDPKEGKAIKPEQHEPLKEGSFEEVNKWWEENKEKLESGDYKMLMVLKNCKQRIWERTL